MAGFEVIDAAYKQTDCINLFSYAKNSYYKFGWGEAGWSDVNGQERILHCNLSDEDVDTFGFLKEPMLQNKRLINLIGGRKPVRSVINLADPSNCFCRHVHSDYDVMVYYMNTRWNPEWAGETIIYSDVIDEAEYAVSFRPSRVLWLGAGTPHSLRPPSIAAPEMRFTLASLFKVQR